MWLTKSKTRNEGFQVIRQTARTLIFLSGTFLLFVTCNKAHGSAGPYSSDASFIQSSSCLKDSSSVMSVSFTSSSKGRSGPRSDLYLVGFIADDWIVEYAWNEQMIITYSPYIYNINNLSASIMIVLSIKMRQRQLLQQF